MHDEREAKLTIINRLLASFPSTQAGVGDDGLDGYELGISQIPVEFVVVAAQRFLSGQVPGQNTAFPPSPAQLASDAREHWYRRLDDAKRERQMRELPPPEIKRSPEEIARVTAMVDALVKRNAELMRTEDAEADQRRRELSDRTNERFAPDTDAIAMKRRLGFAVGDVDGDRDVA